MQCRSQVVMKNGALYVLDAAFSLRMSKRIDTATKLLFDTDLQSTPIYKSDSKDAFEMESKESDVSYSNPIHNEAARSPSGELTQLQSHRVAVIATALLEDDFKEHTDNLTSIFVNNLQYTENKKALFSTAETLITMKLFKFEMVRVLKDVVLIENDAELSSFLVVKHAVGDFVRLSKRLHEEAACKECVSVVNRLRDLCVEERQNHDFGTSSLEPLFLNKRLMARLGCAENIIFVLTLDVKTESLNAVQHAVFELVQHFVLGCPENQEALHDDIEPIFVPFLGREDADGNLEFIEEVSSCIGEIVSDNESIATKFSISLTQVSPAMVVALRTSR